MARRTMDDEEQGQPAAVNFADGPSGNYNPANADWGDEGGAPARPGLTAKAEAAGFSPVRQHRGRHHSLEVDPRTKLRIIGVPQERRVTFAELQDAVIHVFLDCLKCAAGNNFQNRVLVITDQTLFLCDTEGAVGRCFMVDQIKSLSVCGDPKILGIIVQTEYDLVLKFPNASDRDRVIKALRTVYRRLAREPTGHGIVGRGRMHDDR